MGILDRFGSIMSANINALLDKLEDPSKQIDQCLRDASEDLAEVKKETAAVLAEEKRCKRNLDEIQREVDRYTQLAKNALTAGNEGDARQLLARKQQYEQNLATAQNNYNVAHNNAVNIRAMHDKLVTDINSLKARRNNIKATMSVAKTQQRMNNVAASFDGARGAISSFDRMEEKAQSMLDSAMAMADLNAGPDDPVDDIASKYEGGGSASVDDELAALKAEMGL